MTGNTVAFLARFRGVVLVIAAIVTVGCGYLATRVEVSFDVKDFFAADTDFVVGLDKFQEHSGEQGGEPAYVYVETDLSQTEALTAIERFEDRLRHLETSVLAREDTGLLRIDASVHQVLEAVMTQPAARAAIAESEGCQLTDENGDGLPDDATQLAALYQFTLREGVPSDREDPDALVMSPDQVQSRLWYQSGVEAATRIGLWLQGTATQENTRQARRDVAPLLEELRTELLTISARSRVELTGRPIVRQASQDAIFRAFLLSLPVAVLLCFGIALVFMRSLRFALVSIVPVVLVVTWLHALMVLLDLPMNLVSSTIGAISVGIGIDYAVHFTMRFREELERSTFSTKLDAMREAGAGTGLALLASATSSIIGFSILAFAPMPLFASYGLLTTLMILLAASATLVVLPALLMLVTKEPNQEARSR